MTEKFKVATENGRDVIYQPRQVCRDKEFNVATNSSARERDQRGLYRKKKKAVATIDPGNCEKHCRDNVLLNHDKGWKEPQEECRNILYYVATMNEELKAKLCHNNWKLGQDIKESRRLKNSVVTQKFYVATQTSVVEGNLVATYYSSIQATRHPRIFTTQDTLVAT